MGKSGNAQDKSITSTPPEFDFGAPGKYLLDIQELSPGKLVAQSRDIRGPWIMPTVLISLGLTLLSLLGAWKGFFADDVNIAMGISCLFLGVLCFAVAVFSLGCLSYRARLLIDRQGVRYENRFLWMDTNIQATIDDVQYLKCWQHATGRQRGVQIRTCYLCIHFHCDIPTLDLHSVEFIPSHTQNMAYSLGLSDDARAAKTYEEAASEVIEKGEAVSRAIDIPLAVN